MVKFEILSRRKKEILAEVERLGEEEDFHHFYWRVRDPEAACRECQRRHGRLVNKYDIRYTLDTEYCVADGDEICPFDLAPIRPKTVYEERDRLLAELASLEAEGVEGIRWITADAEGLADQCIRRDRRVFTLDQARAELEGEFCRFADPQKGCECTFERASAEEVERVRSPEPAAAPTEEKTKASGCGAGILLFLLPAFVVGLERLLA